MQNKTHFTIGTAVTKDVFSSVLETKTSYSITGLVDRLHLNPFTVKLLDRNHSYMYLEINLVYHHFLGCKLVIDMSWTKSFQYC